MTHMSYEDAKARFDELARKARAGETTVVTRDGREVFRVAPVEPVYKPQPKRPGLLTGKIRMAPDFNETPEEIIRDWEGAHDDPA